MTTRRLLIIHSGKLIYKDVISKLGKQAIRPICGSRSKPNFKMKCFRACKRRLTRQVRRKNGTMNDSLRTKSWELLSKQSWMQFSRLRCGTKRRKIIWTKQQVATNLNNIKTTSNRKTGMSWAQKESSGESKNVIFTLRNTKSTRVLTKRLH